MMTDLIGYLFVMPSLYKFVSFDAPYFYIDRKLIELHNTSYLNLHKNHVDSHTRNNEVIIMAVAHKGAISFGLVHIPVSLYRTTRDNDISFNQLCKESKQRVHYKKYCANCEKELKPQDIVKGYQYEKDQYVIMTQEELDAIKSEKDKTIHIQQFCDLADIDDIYYEKNYYAIPDTGSEKAYELLRNAMNKEGKVAIAKTVLGTKETLLALCPEEDYILMKTLFYQDEVVNLPKAFQHPKVDKSEETIAKQLINAMSAPFDPAKFHDEYQERLMAAIQEKIKGHKIVAPAQKDTGDITDLMEALKQSVALQKKSTGKKKVVRH